MVRIGTHVAEICDSVGAKGNVVAIAHDWGCGLLSSIVKQSQDRFVGFVFVAIGHMPDALGSIDEINQKTKESLGYSLFGYFKFHDQDDAAEVIGKNVSLNFFGEFACVCVELNDVQGSCVYVSCVPGGSEILDD